jgi:hypothetical protein
MGPTLRRAEIPGPGGCQRRQGDGHGGGSQDQRHPRENPQQIRYNFAGIGWVKTSKKPGQSPSPLAINGRILALHLRIPNKKSWPNKNLK